MEGVGCLCKLLPKVVVEFLTLSFLAQIIFTLLIKPDKSTIEPDESEFSDRLRNSEKRGS